jgi:hypothetical protein
MASPPVGLYWYPIKKYSIPFLEFLGVSHLNSKDSSNRTNPERKMDVRPSRS